MAHAAQPMPGFLPRHFPRNSESAGHYSSWTEGEEASEEGGFLKTFNRTGKVFKYLLRPESQPRQNRASYPSIQKNG
jgi:hypothetical protein